MSEAFFNALDQSDEKEPKQSSFFNALEKDEEINTSPSNSFFDALDADTSLSAGSDTPPVSGSNQPSLSFDPSLIEPIGSSMIGNPIEANTLMADQIAAGDAPQVITYEPEPVSDPTLLSPEEAEFERLNRIMMQPGPKPNINLNPSISQVQGDFGNFRVSEDAGYIANLPLSNTEALKQIARGNLYEATNNALSRGVGRLSQVTNILGQQLGLKDTSEFISRMQELDRIYPDAPKEVQDALKKISEADTYSEAFIEMTKNLGAVLSVVGESFPMMLPGLAAATGVTLATGNPILGAMTIGASSGSVEFGNVLMEELRSSGVDMNDNAALEAQLNNGEFWARARKRATARGVPIALFDALSFGIAGKLTGLARGSGFKTTAAAVGTESVVLQPALGATGERVAQEAELQLGFREKINKGEVALEGVSEAPIGVIETATGIINEQKNQDPVEQYFREANKLLDKSGSDLNAATQIAIEQQVPVQDIDYTAKLLELAVQYENIGNERGTRAGQQIRDTIERANSDDPKKNTFARQSFSKQTIEFHTERVAKFKAEAEGTAQLKPKPENVFESTLVQNDREKKKFDLAMQHPEAGPVLKDMAEKMQMLSDRMHELGYIWYEAHEKATTPKEIKNAAAFMSNMGSAMRLINRTQANVLGYQGKRAITDEQLSRDISALQSVISAPQKFPSLENVQANPEAPNVKTEVQQPTVDSAASDTVDVPAQPDPSLTSDVPTDLTAPPKVEPPKVDTTPIEKPEVKTEPPKVETPQILNPQDRAEVGIDTDGAVESVQTPDGQKTYNVKGKVVELEDLKQAVGDLQPRDRSKKESTTLAVQRAGTMFNPQRLLKDPTSGSGAPIIARDGTIMSGNGRVLTMQEVYANQPKSLEAYQTALKEAGINTEGFSQPVFVRQLNDDMTIDQLKEFADLSNTEAQAQMTSTETAQRDAKRMPQNLINLYTGGDITSAENKSFVTGFAVQVLSPTEQGQFSVDGKPTKNAISRMQAAILATAYDDTDTLSIMLDSTDENIKAISNAMMASAPQLSQLKADIKDGNVKSDFDISKQIAEAAKTISNLRDQKVKPRDYFDQQDAFSQTDPLTEAIIKAFYNEELTRAKSQKFMTDVLNFYVQESGKRQENALFEDEVTPKDVIGAARKKAERKADGTDENQGSLLAEASPSKSVNESRKQTQSPKRTRSSKRLDADQPAAEVQEDELGSSTSDPSNVVTTTSGFVFDNVSQTLRQSIYRDAFADSGLSVDAIENKSTEAKFKILAETVKDKFGLSGVKAPRGGGYTQVNQLLDAYHNLQWMTHALAMPNTFIGLDGKLSLELPDRVGRYLGAFESGSNNVIMPQRSNSFAHEFGHALDYYLMDKYGNFEEAGKDTRGISGLIRKTAKAGSRPWQDGTPVNVETAFGNMINALFLDNAELSYKIMQLEQAIAKGEAREAKTGVTTKSLEKLRNQLEKLLEGSGRSKVSPTKFKKTSAQFGASVKMKDYYLRPTEMFARAFEAYIARTVEAAGGRNEFITKGDEAYKLAADQVKGSDIRLAETFPKDEERHNIFLAMDRLMDALRAESIAEGTVANAPGDTDMIDARANFWGSMQYEERNRMRDIPKRVVQSIINDQKRAHRIAQGRAETLKLRPQKYSGNNFVERKINEYRDLFGGNFIETKRQILFNASDQNKDNKRVRKIMENIISKIATDPGTRQNRVTQQDGTFEEATRIETRRFYAVYDQIAKKYDMDLLTDAEQKSLRLLLTGESEATANASPKTLELAAELRRRLLNPIYDYMVKSGQEINYVQGVGYMPRMLDAPLAIQEKPDFMGTLQGDKGAVPLYRNVIFENEYGVFEEGDLDQMKALVKLAMSNPDKTDLGNLIANEYSDLRDIAEVMREQIKEINRLEKTIDEDPAAEAKIQEIIDSMDQEHFKLHEELRDPYALTAAEDWHKRISVREGADPSTNGVQGSYAKKRKLPPEADKYMNDFYLNPTDALMQYIPSAVRSTEYNKIFGKDLVPVGSKMKDGRQIDYLEYLIDEAKMAGMPTHQAQEVNTIVQMVTGRYPGPDGSFNKALNTINTYGTMALLPRAVLSSVAEPITAAIQTGSTVKGFKNFILAMDGLGASLRGKDAVERKMYYAQLANILGVIDLPQTGEVVANRLGGTVAEDAKNTMRLATFFLRTGLTNITIAQRKASMRTGIQYIIEQAAQYNNPDISESLKEEARQTLRDFGINERIIKQFTEFAQNLDKTDNGLYEIDQIMDVDGSLTDMGRVLATAVNRFVDQTIQDPKIMDRPKWAESPIGRIVFGIQSFIAAFQRNVLEMSVKRAARDFKTQGLVGGSTRLVRKMMLPLFSLYAGHTLVSAAREFIFNRDKWEEEAEEEDRYIPAKYLMTLGISRSGLLGRADPVFNGFFSLKYQADLSNVAVGASGAYYLKAVQRIWGLGVENSPNTVSREYQAVRGLYDIFVPALAGGLATIPGVSNTLGYGLGALDMAVTSPSVKHWVTRNIIKQATGETYYPNRYQRNKESSRLY